MRRKRICAEFVRKEVYWVDLRKRIEAFKKLLGRERGF